MAYQSSLFTAPTAGPIEGAMGWLNATLQSQVAIGLCILAVAFIGLTMLTGRLPIRRGMQVVLGCFVLLGAPAIAAGFTGLWQDARSPAPVATVNTPTVLYERQLPPATYDPYAGASLRRDRAP